MGQADELSYGKVLRIKQNMFELKLKSKLAVEAVIRVGVQLWFQVGGNGWVGGIQIINANLNSSWNCSWSWSWAWQ